MPQGNNYANEIYRPLNKFLWHPHITPHTNWKIL